MSAKAPADIEIRFLAEGATGSSAPNKAIGRVEKSKDFAAASGLGETSNEAEQRREMTKAEDKKKLYRMALNRIRAIMISLVVFFHCSGCYQDDSPVFFLVRNLMRDWMIYLNVIIGESAWPMFVFFTLSGYAAYHSLRVRSLREFVQDRSLRLIPPVIFGIFVLEAFTIYLIYYMGRGYWDSYFQFENFIDFYVRFYSNCFGHIAPLCPLPRFVIGIYWYIMYLWVFCMLAIPLFLLWKTYPSPSVTTKISKSITIAGFLMLPLLVWGLEVAWCYTRNFSYVMLFTENNVFAYFFFLFFGFFLAWCKDAHELLLDCYWFFLALSVALIPIICNTDLPGLMYTRPFTTILLLDSFAVFTCFSVWALAHKTLPFLPKRLGVSFDYIADRAIAIYVLHYLVQYCVLVVLYYIRGDSFLNYNAIAHLLLHFVFSYLCTLAVYEALFSWRYTKFLVGMLRVSDLQSSSTSKPDSAKKSQSPDVSPPSGA